MVPGKGLKLEHNLSFLYKVNFTFICCEQHFICKKLQELISIYINC